MPAGCGLRAVRYRYEADLARLGMIAVKRHAPRRLAEPMTMHDGYCLLGRSCQQASLGSMTLARAT